MTVASLLASLLDALMHRRAERRRDSDIGQRVMRVSHIRREPAPGTYTIALYGDVLLTTFPDGRDRDAEIGKAERAAGVTVDRARIVYHAGLLLTDDRPADLDRVVFYADCYTGFLLDAEAHSYAYAMRPLA